NFYQIDNGGTELASTGASGTYPYTSMETFTQDGSNIIAIDDGYTISATDTSYTSGYVGFNPLFSGSANNNAMFVQYIRTRQLPPNNIMPSFMLGQYT
ncbi:MAG: hypothetical protein ACP5M9_04125, partial [Candidatus Micrarchaeia archaeon]